MTTAFLRPIDRLYFGPPRGRSAGEIHSGRSEFPPSPHTIAGILRTHLLRDAERRGALSHALHDRSRPAAIARSTLVGDRHRLAPGWRLGPTFPAFPASRQPGAALMPWLPMPRCVSFAEDGVPRWPRRVRWPGDGLPTIFTDEVPARTSWYAPPHGRTLDEPPGWLSAAALSEVLRGQMPSAMTRDARSSLPPFVRREVWTGIAVEDPTRRVSDGMLYSLDMLRFVDGGGLVTWAEVSHRDGLDPAALGRGVARAGSKGHLVHIERAHIDSAWDELLRSPALDDMEADEVEVILYLATPARIPDHRDPLAALRPQPPAGVSASVQAAFVDAPLWIGGLDTVTMQPQTNAQHLAPGSCWFLRVFGGTRADRASWLRSLHGARSLAEPDAAAFGYGLTFIGRLPAAIQGDRHAVQ